MNPTSQLDLHPEAESLNAFAEQALPERERAQILAHLAACRRCRQVVYLAQQAAAADEPAPVAAVHSPASWLRNWWFTWVPAAALATVVGLAVFVHVRRAETGSELARITPQSEQHAPVAPAAEQANAAAAAAAPASVAAKRSRVNPPSAPPPRPASELPAAPAPAAAPPALSGAFEGAKAENLPPVAANASWLEFRTQEASAAMKSQASAAAWRQQQEARALSDATTGANQPAGMDVGAAPSAPAGGSTAPTAARPQFALQSAPSAGFDERPPRSSAALDAVAVATTGPITLPSGFHAVSVATAQYVTLALDRAGALFRSEDHGAHWEPVARQWAGRAVTVRTALAAGFELVNESGLIWVSPDGQTWNAK